MSSALRVSLLSSLAAVAALPVRADEPANFPIPSNLWTTSSPLPTAARKRREQVRLHLTTITGYNSNPEETQVGGNPSLAAETSVFVEWQPHTPKLPFQFTLQAGLEGTRFQRAPSAQSDRGILSLRLTPHNALGQVIRPYLVYLQRHQFSPTFSRLAFTRHDFNAGVTVELPSPREGAWTFLLGAVLQRRIQSQGTASVAAGFGFSVSWPVSPHWSAAVELGIARRWFDWRQRRATREWGFSPAFSLEYRPDWSWFGEGEPPRIRFRIGYSRLLTTFPSGSYHQWAVGPTFQTTWVF